MEENRRDPPGGDARPTNRVTSEGLRKVELAFFGLLFLTLSGLMIWRGIGFLIRGEASFPLVGLFLPEPLGYVAGAFYLLLASGIALATFVIVAHFRK